MAMTSSDNIDKGVIRLDFVVGHIIGNAISLLGILGGLDYARDKLREYVENDALWDDFARAMPAVTAVAQQAMAETKRGGKPQKN